MILGVITLFDTGFLAIGDVSRTFFCNSVIRLSNLCFNFPESDSLPSWHVYLPWIS